MRLDKKSLLLYLVTDRTWTSETNTLEMQVENAIEGGVTFVQLREKNLDFETFLMHAEKIKAITDKYKIPFVINDNVEVTLAVGADGIHIGQGDMEAAAVRKLIGKDRILGVSAQNVEQALKAQLDGADYIGVGAVFSTSTKLDADSVAHETLKEICQTVSIPVIAIGGINKDNITGLKGTGIVGTAVISAILGEAQIELASRKLSELCKELFED